MLSCAVRCTKNKLTNSMIHPNTCCCCCSWSTAGFCYGHWSGILLPWSCLTVYSRIWKYSSALAWTWLALSMSFEYKKQFDAAHYQVQHITSQTYNFLWRCSKCIVNWIKVGTWWLFNHFVFGLCFIGSALLRKKTSLAITIILCSVGLCHH